MRFIDLFWWFLDGDKSSGEIIAEKKKPQQQHNESGEVHQYEECVEDFEDEEFEDFFS